MKNHDISINFLLQKRSDILMLAKYHVQENRVKKDGIKYSPNLIDEVKHLRSKAKSILCTVKALRELQNHCSYCMNTGYLKGTNEYETDSVCVFCKRYL